MKKYSEEAYLQVVRDLSIYALNLTPEQIYCEIIDIYFFNSEYPKNKLKKLESRIISGEGNPSTLSYEILGTNIFSKDLHYYHIVAHQTIIDRIEKLFKINFDKNSTQESRDKLNEIISLLILDKNDLIIKGKSTLRNFSKTYSEFRKRQNNKAKKL